MDKLYFGAVDERRFVDRCRPLLPQRWLLLPPFVFGEFSCHRAICGVPIEHLEHLHRFLLAAAQLSP
jgi:hypothetical protein